MLAPWCLSTETEEWVKDETKRIGEEKQAALAAAGNKAAAQAAEAAKEQNAEGESKQLTGAAKTLCIPFVQPDMPKGTPCFTGRGGEAREWTLWGRSY